MIDDDDEDEDGGDSSKPSLQPRPDWDDICNKLLQEENKESNDDSNTASSSSSSSLITPYRCMVHYKTKLAPKSSAPNFTSQEDEFLLRYIAAMGPQLCWELQEYSHLAQRLFPTKEPRRLYERTQFSLWSPLAKDTYWTSQEEQKLVLAMKIYSDLGLVKAGNDGDDE